MIRVLITDDSRATQRILSTLLSNERGIEIVGTASNGREAIAKFKELQPDLTTMDIYMPEMDGLEATRRIMAEYPGARIVIISSMVNSKDLKTSFEAMRSGAIEVIGKPSGVLSGDYSEVRKSLISVLKKLMDAHPANRFSWSPTVAQDRVSQKPVPVSMEPSEGVEAKASSSQQSVSGATDDEIADCESPEEVLESVGGVVELPPGPEYSSIIRDNIPLNFFPSAICIGGSTGAPAVLVDILSRLPSDYPVPILVAQHIARGFAGGLADWLDSSCRLVAKLAVKGDVARPGTIVVSRDDHHIRLRLRGIIDLTPSTRSEQHTPSVNIFFESAAEAFGPRGLGIILTGMGSDGAQGLLRMRQAGGVTVAQNEKTSVVYGMPKVAVECGAVIEEMSPPEIIDLLLRIGKYIKGRG